MAESTYGIGSVADQRYYHFILWKTKRDLSLPALWRRIGDVVDPVRPLGSRNSLYSIQHRKLRSETSYGRAGIAAELSENGKGEPPFYYDVFVMTIDVERISYLLIGFPFVNLGLESVKKLLEKHRFEEESEHQCVYVPRLLPQLEDGLPPTHDGLTTRVVGVQWSVQSDASLTSIRLGGDAPLKADLYLEYLRPLARQKKSPLLPEQCSLAFEGEVPVEGSAGRGPIAAFVRSRLHVDLDGSFRFYTQAGCRNINLLPFAIRNLWSLGCIEKAHTESPLNSLRAGYTGE
jgi:hypothetical protein